MTLLAKTKLPQHRLVVDPYNFIIHGIPSGREIVGHWGAKHQIFIGALLYSVDNTRLPLTNKLITHTIITFAYYQDNIGALTSEMINDPGDPRGFSKLPVNVRVHFLYHVFKALPNITPQKIVALAFVEYCLNPGQNKIEAVINRTKLESFAKPFKAQHPLSFQAEFDATQGLGRDLLCLNIRWEMTEDVQQRIIIRVRDTAVVLIEDEVQKVSRFPRIFTCKFDLGQMPYLQTTPPTLDSSGNPISNAQLVVEYFQAMGFQFPPIKYGETPDDEIWCLGERTEILSKCPVSTVYE